MLNLDAVAKRIKERCQGFSGRVGLASEYSESLKSDVPGSDIDVPHVFVIPLYERGEEKDRAGQVYQDAMGYFATVVCISNKIQGGQGGASKSAATSLALLRVLKVQLAGAFLGWTMEESTGTVSFEQGFQMDMNNDRLWYQWQWSAPFRDMAVYVAGEEDNPDTLSEEDQAIYDGLPIKSADTVATLLGEDSGEIIEVHNPTFVRENCNPVAGAAGTSELTEEELAFLYGDLHGTETTPTRDNI